MAVTVDTAELQPAIITVPAKAGDGAYYEAKWRDRDGEQVKRRLGRAWLDPAGEGEWSRRRGRTPPGWLDERSVHVAAVQVVARVEADRALHRSAAAAEQTVTFRQVAWEWFERRRDVKAAAPSSLRDTEILLGDPGARHKRGRGRAKGAS